MSDPALQLVRSAVFDMPPVGAGFDLRAAWLVRALMGDLDLTPPQAASICGNLGGESGLTAIQERRPLVPGSAGGFGWAQWTGSRRTAFSQFCASQGLAVTSDEGNYGFLLEELRGEQAHSLVQLKKTSTLEAGVYTFEAIFERPSDLQSQLQERIDFAKRALAGFNDPTHAGLQIPPKPQVRPPRPQLPIPWQQPPQEPQVPVGGSAVVTPTVSSIMGAGISTGSGAFAGAVVWWVWWLFSLRGVAVPQEGLVSLYIMITGIVSFLAHSAVLKAAEAKLLKDFQG